MIRLVSALEEPLASRISRVAAVAVVLFVVVVVVEQLGSFGEVDSLNSEVWLMDGAMAVEDFLLVQVGLVC